MAKEPKNELVSRVDEPPKAVDIISPNVAAISEFLEDDAAQGNDFGREDVALPFLRILQSNSPEVKRGDPNQIVGAREGDFFNTATKDVFDGEKGVVLVPVYFCRSYTEWRPRTNDGGGLVHDYGQDGSILQQTSKHPENGRDVLPNGNEVVMAGQYYCLLVDPETGDWSPVVVGLSSTQFKKSRRWNTLIDSLIVTHPTNGKRFKPAMFYQSYLCRSVPESNARGSWSGWLIEKFKPVIELPGGGEIYLNARELRESVIRGEVKVQPPEGSPMSTEETPARDYEEGQGFPPSHGEDEPY